MLKKILSDKIDGTKMPSFFFRELQLVTVLQFAILIWAEVQGSSL